MAGILRGMLGVSDALSKFLGRGGELNTMRLIEMFMQEGDPYDFVWQSKCMSVLCMCLLAAYLQVSSDGHASHLLVGVHAQMEERRDVVPLVLVETLIGLDAFHAGQTRQMWLCDKIGVLRLPSTSWNYNRCVFPSRQYQAMYVNVAGWLSFLSLLSGEDIFWKCSWLSLPNMAIRNMNTQRMVLAGLSNFTFYTLSRILRQLGMRQRILFGNPEEFEMPRFRAATLAAYAQTWRVRMVSPAEPDPSIMIRKSYNSMLRKELRARGIRV